jgi:hypothetical protein
VSAQGGRPHPETLLGRDSLGDAFERVWAAVRPVKAVGGWATVELDRAEREVREALTALGDARVEERPDDDLLGARCRILRYDGDRDMLLLEPSTEGRLAASLARYGEGSVALYLFGAPGAAGRLAEAGLVLSGAAPGPLGGQRLVLAGRAWGPHLLLVDEPATTIGR